MVFRGKPSKACHSCRERRLKCDLVRPKCSQCVRAQRECPGYRSHSNDRFLDQTGEILEKSRLAKSTRIEQAQSNQEMIRELPRSLMQPVDARAVSFFLSKYILGSKFEYLASCYTPYSDREEQLSASIEAVGLATLSNELESLEVSVEARKRYVRAIQETSTALQDPVRARKDSTLIAVLLLSLYEVLTCTTQHSMCSWENHIKGAIALIRLRGNQQMHSQMGLQLLNQVTISEAISAQRSKAEVTPEIVSLVAHALQYTDEDNPSWSFRLLLFRSVNLRAAIETGSLSNPDVIIATAMELDDEFVAWSRTLPPSWQFEKHLVEEADPALVYEGYYHLYPNHRIAQGMNAWRMSRLQLNELIWEQDIRQHNSPSQSQDYVKLMKQVGSAITSLCSEICATVPQYVELPAGLPVSVCRIQSLITTTCEAPIYMAKNPAGFTHSARSYTIIWHLMAVVNCVIPHSPRRAWVINRLQYISRHMKNPQARLALEILEGVQNAGKRMYMCHLL